MRKKKIRIHWSAPILLEEAMHSPLVLQSGLYYITRIFGSHETSLYLGKATRTIKERLAAHNRDWLPLYRGKIYVRIGQIVYPREIDEELIDHAESALIFEHGDIFTDNTDKRFSYSYSDLYVVENTGDYFELHPIVDMYEHPGQ